MDPTSSVARGGGGRGGGLEPPHWLVKYAKSHVFGAFEADFLWKVENSPPPIGKQPPSNVWISEFGWKISLNFGEDLFFSLETTWIWAKKTFKIPILAEKSVSILVKTFFLWRPPDFGRKNLWISELSEKFRLNFRTNCVKSIQEQWKFRSRSFALFSSFKIAPPFSKSWLRAWIKPVPPLRGAKGAVPP